MQVTENQENNQEQAIDVKNTKVLPEIKAVPTRKTSTQSAYGQHTQSQQVNSPNDSKQQILEVKSRNQQTNQNQRFKKSTRSESSTEANLTKYSQLFNCSNVSLSILTIIFAVVRCKTIFTMGAANITAGAMYIISDAFILVGVIFGIYGVSNRISQKIGVYQKMFAISSVAELIGSIIIITTYETDGQSLSIIFYVAFLLILILFYVLYIVRARMIMLLLIQLEQAKKPISSDKKGLTQQD